MPDNQPSSAPQMDAPQPSDDLTAAAVLRDDALAGTPGGGGLGAAAGPLGGDAAGQMGAATPNSPIDPQLPHEAGQTRAEAEARLLATDGGTPEPGHTSQ